MDLKEFQKSVISGHSVLKILFTELGNIASEVLRFIFHLFKRLKFFLQIFVAGEAKRFCDGPCW